MKSIERVIRRVGAALAIFGMIVMPLAVRAATLSSVSDTMSEQKIGLASNHTLRSTTPTGVDASSDTVTVSFSGFSLASIGVGDIDLTHGPTTGAENTDTLAASPAAGVWGVSISGTTVTFTAPTDAAVGTIVAGHKVIIAIGTNAVGGVNQILNPSTAGSYSVTFGGTFGDAALVAVAAISSDVAVTAQVGTPPPGGGGGGGGGYDTTPPVISNVQASTTSFTTAVITWETNEIANSLVSFGHTVGYASGTVSDSSFVISHSIPLSGLIPCTTYHYRVTSVDQYLNSANSGDGTFTMPCTSAPPVISNIMASTTSFTTATVTWTTDIVANSLVEYGQTSGYASGTVSNAAFVTSHSADLLNLQPCTTYHYRVSSMDPVGQTTVSGDETFTMPCNPLPPVISNIQVVNITDTSAVVQWTTNEPATSLVDYGTNVGYGSQGTAIGHVTTHSVPLSGLAPGTTYHARITTSNVGGQTTVSSDFIFTTTIDVTSPSNVTLTATAGDAQVLLTWTVPGDPDFSGTKIVRRTDGFPTGPNDGTVVYNGSGTSHSDTGLTNGTTYYYGAYAYDTSNNFASGALASATPLASLPPPVPPPVVPPVVPPVTPPNVPTPTPIPSAGGVTTTPPTPGATIAVDIFGSGGTLPLTPGADGSVGVLSNSSAVVSVPASSINGTPSVVAFVINGSTYNLVFDPKTNAYVGSIPMPGGDGAYAAKGQAVLTDGRVAEAPLVIRTRSGGRVVEQVLIGRGTVPVPDASVTLYVEQGGTWNVWNGSAYGQSNPVLTNANGGYAFQVPPGRYFAEAVKAGYQKGTTPAIFVDNNVYGELISLIRVPKSLASVVSASSTVVENAVAIAKNVGEKVAYGLSVVEKAVASPEVQEATKNVALPATVTLTVVNAASAVSLFNTLAYAQYLFTQPLLLLGRRKRKRWGIVYNALTKQPVDLAIVRLLHGETGLTVQTRVTDKLGRYVFNAQPGTYRIEISKPGYIFPSQFLKGKKVDGDIIDLYFGDLIVVEERVAIVANIPLDPMTAEETPRQVILRKALLRFQHIVAFSGVFVSLAIYIIMPSTMTALLVLLQLVMYFVFRRLRLPRKPKHWGIVSDVSSRKPITRAIVRIFESKFNKLLETQVTDRSGRYGFLVRKNVYYVNAEAPGYRTERTPDIDLTNSEEGVIAGHINLHPAGSAPATSPQDLVLPSQPPSPSTDQTPPSGSSPTVNSTVPSKPTNVPTSSTQVTPTSSPVLPIEKTQSSNAASTNAVGGPVSANLGWEAATIVKSSDVKKPATVESSSTQDQKRKVDVSPEVSKSNTDVPVDTTKEVKDQNSVNFIK
jgi:hypothetical protein